MSRRPTVTRPGLIFDDHGNVWSTSTEDLRRYLASDLSMSALLDEVVVDRGFVRVDRLDRGIRIQLRPDTLSQAAYAQVMHWLTDQKEDRIFLTTVADSNAEHISTVSEIKQRLGVYVKNSRMLSEQRLRRTPIPASALGPKSPLRSFRQLWEHGIDPSDAEFVGACDRHFQGSYTLSEAVATGDLIIRMSGRGYVIYKAPYLSRCAGLRLEDDPDFEYGLWIKDAHREAVSYTHLTLPTSDLV